MIQGVTRTEFLKVVTMCQRPVSDAGVVHEFGLVCADGREASECVPTCNETLHGDLLLLNVDGIDHKYSCELSNGVYSWVGPSSDGGYIGFFLGIVLGLNRA